MRSVFRPAAVLPFVFMLIPLPSFAADCTEIAAVPVNLTKSGVYCLRKPLTFAAAEGIAIHIRADNVVLDLNGQVLEGSAGAATSAAAVYTENQRNVTVRNGTITGFRNAIGMSQPDPSIGTTGYVVENMQVLRSTWSAVNLEGPGAIVRNNVIIRTGGSPHIPQGWANSAISVGGAGAHIVGNRIIDTFELSGGQAIAITQVGDGTIIERNLISNFALGPSTSDGIRAFGSKVTVSGNRISNMQHGIRFGFGGNGLYVDNTVGGAAFPFTGGTPAGATNFSF